MFVPKHIQVSWYAMCGMNTTLFVPRNFLDNAADHAREEVTWAVIAGNFSVSSPILNLWNRAAKHQIIISFSCTGNNNKYCSLFVIFNNQRCKNTDNFFACSAEAVIKSYQFVTTRKGNGIKRAVLSNPTTGDFTSNFFFFLRLGRKRGNSFSCFPHFSFDNTIWRDALLSIYINTNGT